MSCYSVIGGGIGGLSAAYYIKQILPSSRVLLLEGSDRLGGWIQTTRFKDGSRHEHGPRTIRPAGIQGANTLKLAEELGLQDEIVSIPYGHPTTKNRLILVNNELHKLPSSIGSAFFTQKPFQKPLISAILKDIRTQKKECSDEPLFDFVSRRLGSDVANYLIDPMVRGICAGDAKEISSAAFVAGPLFQMEQDYGGIVKGMIKSMMKKSNVEDLGSSDLVKKARSEKWSVWSCKNGLETLVQKLKMKLEEKGVEIHTNAEVNSIKIHNGATLTVENMAEIHCDHAFLTLPAFSASNLIPQLSNLLQSIPFVNVAVVTVEFDTKVIDLEAFGFLVPSSEPVPILGAIFDTCSFPQGSKSIFTVMMGGKWFEQLFGFDPDLQSMKIIAVTELKKILKISNDPSRVEIKIQRYCIPQYVVGHKDKVGQLRKVIKSEKLPLSLVGSSYDGVGINDVIMSAKQQVQNVLKS